MASKSSARRQKAIVVCSGKHRYFTMLQAGIQARRVREKIPGDKRVVPYLCPSGATGLHYHIGKNYLGGQKIIDVLYRIRIGLEIKDGELDYAGLNRDEADVIKMRGEYLTHKEGKCL